MNYEYEITQSNRKITAIIETLGALLLAYQIHDEGANLRLLDAISKVDNDFDDKLKNIDND